MGETPKRTELPPAPLRYYSKRSTLKSLETTKGKLFGNDCFVGNIVLQLNKFRFKDGKVDPRGSHSSMITIFREACSPGTGATVYMCSSTCGILRQHYDLIAHFLRHGAVSCFGLQAAILSDFNTAVAKGEMRVLCIIGKLLTGPWMTKFYTSASEQVSHVEGIAVVRSVIDTISMAIAQPLNVLHTTNAFLGNTLPSSGETLQKLWEKPVRESLFITMMKECLTTTVTVLQRQYERYFNTDVTEQLKEETESARTHNIDA